MITQLSASALAAKLASRELSAREVTQAFIERTEAQDPQYGAFLRTDPRALAAADAAQARLDAGDATPLTGIPIALKDNISTEGLETTCASQILRGYIPPFDATVVQQLKSKGAIIFGKTNLDEFAMGASTETSSYQLSRNPWDPARTPGGSSGGSATAVAAELVPLALGSDTGGSIRQPAALCGIVGFKPTYGRSSRYGLVAFGSSLDQIGPLARNVEDAALLANATTGHDPLDGTSLPTEPINISNLKNGSLKGKRAAIPTEMFGDGTQPGVRAAVEQAIERLRKEGVETTEVSLPSIKYGVTTYYIIAPCEASSNLARFDGIRYGPRAEGGQGHIGVVEKTRGELFGHEVKTRIMIGTYALSAGYYDAFYLRAQQVRAIMQQEFLRTFDEYDFVLCPTSPVTAFKFGELDNDPLAMKLLDYCTIPANMGGFPAISLNCGYMDDLPVDLQLMAAPLRDEELLQSAWAVEQVLADLQRRPPIS